MTEPLPRHRPVAVAPNAPGVWRERSLTSAIVETIAEPLLVLDSELRVMAANPAFYRQFKVAPAETLSQTIYSLGNGQWNIAPLRRLLDDVLKEDFHHLRVSRGA